MVGVFVGIEGDDREWHFMMVYSAGSRWYQITWENVYGGSLRRLLYFNGLKKKVGAVLGSGVLQWICTT